MGSEGRAVRYLRSTIVPADEALLCVFEADSEELVREVYARAGVPFERLSAAIADESEWLDSGPPPGAGGAEEAAQQQTQASGDPANIAASRASDEHRAMREQVRKRRSRSHDKGKNTTATAILVVLAALFGAGVIATSADAEPRSVSSNTLTGTWNVTVNRPAPLPPLKSVQVFTSGGALIEMANESQAGRTAQYGAWERIDGRLYSATALFYRFDAKGNFVGTTKMNKTIELGNDGNTFQHIARVGVYDANDKLVQSVVGRASGVRMPIERISDMP